MQTPDYTCWICDSLANDFLGFTTELVGTGGGCKAIEVRAESDPTHYLLISDDAALPDGRPGITGIAVALYAVGEDDEPVTVMEYPCDERVSIVTRVAVALLGEWEQL